MDKWQTQKKLTIETILNKIKEKKEVTLPKLMAELAINDPYISKTRSFDVIRDLREVGKIEIDETGVIKLCQ